MPTLNLTLEDKEKVVQSLDNNTELPEELFNKLFPTLAHDLETGNQLDYQNLHHKIPTIEYKGKRTEGQILKGASLFGTAAPLQKVRCFGEPKDNEWQNLLIQGDNLQFLKTCFLDQDPLIKGKVKGQVKLIYIDPPFATKGDFGGKDGEDSYSDKVDRAEFLETLRERLIFMREILAEDGSIYVHLDQKMSHYVKVLMDEVFGKDRFRNEIVWVYTGPTPTPNDFKRKHDTILRYVKAENFIFNQQFKPYKGLHATKLVSHNSKKLADPEEMRKLLERGKPLEDWWDDAYTVDRVREEIIGYPTQKPEKLLERIIRASSNEGDLVMDCFAGSGTTLAVAEKIGRRWIGCDFGKHSIYTIQKRMLGIQDSKKLGSEDDKKQKYGKSANPFCVVSVGAYDYNRIMNLRTNKDAYIDFVLNLFGVGSKIAGLEKKYKVNGIVAEKDNDPVEVYPVWDDEYLKEIKIDEDYLSGILEQSGGSLKGNYYIIAPESCVLVGPETVLKNSDNEEVHFFILKFPYKILEEVARNFALEEQPSNPANINNLVNSVGFYFNEDVKIEVEKTEIDLKITKFVTGILDKSGNAYEGLSGLSLVMFDYNYNNKEFKVDQAIYAADIKDGVITGLNLTENSAMIAIDKHGNESKVIKI